MTEIQYKHCNDGELQAEFREISKQLEADPQYIEFQQEMDRIGLAHESNMSGGLEMATVNFSKDSEGNLQYVDTADPFMKYGKLILNAIELAFNSRIRI